MNQDEYVTRIPNCLRVGMFVVPANNDAGGLMGKVALIGKSEVLVLYRPIGSTDFLLKYPLGEGKLLQVIKVL